MSRHSKRRRAGLWPALATLVTLTQCVDGGLNQNERAPGDGDQGVNVGFGEIAIDPTGAYFLSRSDEALVHGELATGRTTKLASLSDVERVAFAHEGKSVFLTRNLGEDRARLLRYDLVKGEELWGREVPSEFSWDDRGYGTYPWLDVLADDSRLVLTFSDHVEIVDARTGAELFRTPIESSVVDVDVTPDQKRLLITHEHAWIGESPRTLIEVRELATFAGSYIQVPNCADELVLARDGKHAFLAPTTCQQDPVSVIDLAAGKFERNLPGFGPVALSPKGDIAVAFLDRDNVDEKLFDDRSQIPSAESAQYHLMLIDTSTLAFATVELGDTLPRYALSPDGQMLLIDSDSFWSDGRIRVLDVNTRSLAPVLGPDVRLHNYVMTRDSATVFLLDEGLYRIAMKARTAQAELIEFTPEKLNITPDDRTLVLREDDQTLWLYDVNDARMLRSMSLAE